MAPTEKERLDVLEPVVESLVATTTQLIADLGRVSSRLLVLERRLAGLGAGADEDLDRVDEEIAGTVSALRAAWDAEQDLLADEVRAELRAEVAEYESLQERRDTGRARLEKRMQRFERDALQHSVSQAEWQIHAREAEATEAYHRLEADRKAGEEAWRQEAVAHGDKARGEIQAHARARLQRSLAADARLPVWFRVGLGEITAPDPTPWLRAAATLVAYRLEYGVTDAVHPLGEAPVAAAGGSAAWVRRAKVYEALVKQFEEMRPDSRSYSIT
ncbi:hypothetical protein [Actinosynnema sp.]|uniref:hypothetical protein n=1 Tax=Actinosynnema sp. TaxID=1872144 RepID=UPI003F835C94